MHSKIFIFVAMMFVLTSTLAFAQGQQMMRSRVPPDKLKEARALMNPLPDSPEILEKGKVLYEGKGTCANCHGMSGHGDGAGAANLNPPPRVFRARGFWRHRTEGEIFWVIKHGSPGTAMIPFGGLLSDEEIWMVMQYERSFAGGHGRGGRGRHKGMGLNSQGKERGGKGRHGTMGSKEHRGGMKEGGCCQESESSE